MKRWIHAATQRWIYDYDGPAMYRGQNLLYNKPFQTTAVSEKEALRNFKYRLSLQHFGSSDSQSEIHLDESRLVRLDPVDRDDWLREAYQSR